jgi:CubicO group peptidase (beta-lactamase class C family)
VFAFLVLLTCQLAWVTPDGLAQPAAAGTARAARVAKVPTHAPAVDLAALDRDIAKARDDWQVPGLAVAIVKDGAVALAKGYGVRTLGKPEPVDEHTLFAIASNSKAFTSAALAILADEGKVSWDDRVTAHLPYFQLYDPWVTHEMRVRDLLSHRSGLGTFSGDLLWYGTPYSREEIVRRARFLRPTADFRAGYRYNNLMFIAAGEVVARASGQSWDEFVRARIFEPLGMKNSVTSTSALAGRANAATPHGPTYGPPRPYRWYSWDGMAAAGGVISSAADMAKWLRLQLGRGTVDGRTIFSDAASRQMWTPLISFTVDRAAEQRFPSTHFRGYGMGWSLSDYRGRLVVEHGGAYDGMYSQVVLVPEEQLGFVVLTNSMTNIGSALKYVLIDRYLGGSDRDWSRDFLERARRRDTAHAEEQARIERERVQGTAPSRPLADYAGTYPSDLYGTATVTLEKGALVLRLLPNPDLVADLTHWHFDTFHLRWRNEFPWFADGKAQFVLDNRAHVTEMKLDVPNEDFWFWEPKFLRKQEGDVAR